MITNKGDFGNLPGGEAYIAPIDTGANGTVMYDGTIPQIGRLGNPIRVVFKEGRIEKISGSREALQMWALKSPFVFECSMPLTRCLVNNAAIYKGIHGDFVAVNRGADYVKPLAPALRARTRSLT